MIPWLIMHAEAMVSLFETGNDGRTANERSRDKPYEKELPIFGECVFPTSVG